MTHADEVPAPLCFVLMPFSTKADGAGLTIDFDAVYRDRIAPAIRDAGLEPVRADEELAGGTIHKPMFERLLLCEYAVADLTTANANVFYELGVRHAVRPFSTVLIFAAGTRLPFDVAPDRGLSYAPDDDLRDRLRDRLLAARASTVDSPVFQLVDGLPATGFADIARLRTDLFRSRVDYSERRKNELATARADGVEAVRAVQADLGALPDVEAGILVDLFLSYRAVSAHEQMVALYGELPTPLARTPLIREQLAFALNRLGRRTDAERVLTTLIDERGPSSETYGLLGRVHKDKWADAVAAGRRAESEGHLRRAVDTYLAGFETDWRDAYPGVNAVTLMELAAEPDPRQAKLLPIVAYAVERRLGGRAADYWDHATALELAVLARDESAAREALGDALAAVRERWEPETTARNLAMIREARERRGDAVPWVADLEQELLAGASG